MRPFTLTIAVACGVSAAPRECAASDSALPLSLTLTLDRCPGAGRQLGLSCFVDSAAAVDLYVAVSQPYFAAACDAALNADFALPSAVSVGAVFASHTGTGTVSCEVADPVNGGSLAFASLQLAAEATTWPLWSDAILVAGAAGVMRSWRFGTALALGPALLASLTSSTYCRDRSGGGLKPPAFIVNCSNAASGLALPDVTLRAVVDSWGGLPLSNDSVPDAFTMTLTGASRVALRAADAVFTTNMTVWMGGVVCNVSAVSADGRWALIETPAAAALGEGYASLAVSVQAVASNGTRSRAALACPPFCPGEVPLRGEPVPIPAVTGGGAVQFAVAAPGYGGSTPPAIMEVPASSTGFFYTALCAATGVFTDPSTGACSNASDPASRSCAFGSGDGCGSCPANALCPGGSRLWPLPGVWAASETAGVVIPCTAPATTR